MTATGEYTEKKKKLFQLLVRNYKKHTELNVSFSSRKSEVVFSGRTCIYNFYIYNSQCMASAVTESITNWI